MRYDAKPRGPSSGITVRNDERVPGAPRQPKRRLPIVSRRRAHDRGRALGPLEAIRARAPMGPTQKNERIARFTTNIAAPLDTKRSAQSGTGTGNRAAALALAVMMLTPALAACAGADKQEPRTPEHSSAIERSRSLGRESKIRFDPGRLDPNGLQGPSDGKRALHYEYCIPNRDAVLADVAAIDPTLTIQRESPGRVGCGDAEILCLGHTHQAGYGEVLEKLALLPEIKEIREAFYE